MSRKLVFVGPPGVGKTTLRKIFFEGEHSSHLLKYSLTPTHGQESIILNLKEDIGIFDLAGQENEKWLEGKGKKVFHDAENIIVVVEAKALFENIYNFTKKIIKIREEFYGFTYITLLVHKIDLLDKEELVIIIKKINESFKNEFNFSIEFTSITRDYFLHTYSVFINIISAALSEFPTLKKFDSSLLRIIIKVLSNFKDKNILSYNYLQEKSSLTNQKLNDVIDILKKKNHIETYDVDGENLLMITPEGKKNYKNLINYFPLENLIKFEKNYLKTNELQKKIEVPTIIGFFLVDGTGRVLLNVELFNGAFDVFLELKTPEGELLDIELVPSFISALRSFSKEMNLSDLSDFKLKGRNINMFIFGFESVTAIFFTNPKINIKLLKKKIFEYLESIIENNKEEFEKARRTGSINVLIDLNAEAQQWLAIINKTYTQMLETYEIFDLKRSKKAYNLLDELSEKIEKEFYSIFEEIKNLKMRLMTATFDENISEVEEIFQKIEIIKSQYLR